MENLDNNQIQDITLQAPASEDRSTIFPCSFSKSGVFNAGPLIEFIQEDPPAALADSLDKIYVLLAEYLVADKNTAGLDYVNLLYDIRCLRDAIREGCDEAAPAKSKLAVA